jgi:hypothetical protein
MLVRHGPFKIGYSPSPVQSRSLPLPISFSSSITFTYTKRYGGARVRTNPWKDRYHGGQTAFWGSALCSQSSFEEVPALGGGGGRIGRGRVSGRNPFERRGAPAGQRGGGPRFSPFQVEETAFAFRLYYFCLSKHRCGFSSLQFTSFVFINFLPSHILYTQLSVSSSLLRKQPNPSL